MSEITILKPKRLLVISVLNIVTAISSILISALLLFNSELNIGIDRLSIIIGLIIPLTLLISSIMVLINKNNSYILMFIALLLLKMMIIIQNINMYNELENLVEDKYVNKITINVIKSLIRILLNVWALFSYPSREYFKRMNKFKNSNKKEKEKNI